MYKYLLAALLFVGCTKPPGFEPPVDCKCKLVSIEDTVVNFSVKYRYDAKNRLEYRTLSMNLADIFDFKAFYDKKGRVSHYIGNSGYQLDQYFWEWHALYYDNRNNIVLDSVYNEGFIGANGPYDVLYRYYITYAYDSENRMISETRVYGGSAYTDNFVYDGEGNLSADIYGNQLVYDDHVNPNRTDPFLQFINHDYSKNSVVGASAYNKYGLPLIYPQNGTLHRWMEIGGLSWLQPQFTYSCK